METNIYLEDKHTHTHGHICMELNDQYLYDICIIIC